MAQNTFNPINILDTTDATGIGSGGSLTIGGGASIGKDFYVGGNISISGTTTSFSDNILLINKNPTNSCDTGLLFQRFTNDISNNQNYSGILYSEISDEFHFGYMSSDINRSNATIDSFVRIKTNGINSIGNSNTIGNIYTTGGNVGINNVSPSHRLDVSGGARITTGITTGTVTATNITNTTNTGYAKFLPSTTYSKRIVVFGSSVAYGTGATNNQGWGYKLGEYVTANGWTFNNVSIGGNTTVDLINRFYTDLVPLQPDVVIIGLSLANEGILNSTGKEGVFDQYIGNICRLVDMCRQQCFKVVVGGTYPNNSYTSVEYNYIKQADKFLQSSQIPYINFLGSVDDGTGKWRSGMFSDGGHPNDVGHTAMYRSIPLTLFDRLSYVDQPFYFTYPISSYIVMTGDSTTAAPIRYTVGSEPIGSWTIMCNVAMVRGSASGVALFSVYNGTGGPLRIRAPDGVWECLTNTLLVQSTVRPDDGLVHQIALTYNYYTDTCTLYVDGVNYGSSSTSGWGANITHFDFLGRVDSVGFNANGMQISNLAVYKVALNGNQIAECYRGMYPKSSLEIFSPCTDTALSVGNSLLNVAYSDARLYINTASLSYARTISNTTEVNTSVSKVSSNLIATGNSNTVGNIFTTGGNVGIGTTTPQTRLHIGSNIIYGARSGDYLGGNMFWTGSEWSRISSAAAGFSIRIGDTSDMYGNGMQFLVGDTNNTAVSRMLISASGNVGISNTNPQHRLSVNGTVNIATSLTAGSIFATNSTITNTVSTNISSGTLNLSSGITAASSQITNSNVTTQTVGTARVTTNLMAIGNSNTIGNIFTTGGNVGINNISPSYTVDVTGNLRIGSVIAVSDTTNAPAGAVTGTNVRFSNGGMSYLNQNPPDEYNPSGSTENRPYYYSSSYFVTALTVDPNPDPGYSPYSYFYNPTAFKYIGSGSAVVNWRVQTPGASAPMFGGTYTIYIDILDTDGTTIISTPATLVYGSGSLVTDTGVQTTTLNQNQYIRFRGSGGMSATIEDFVFTYDLQVNVNSLVANSSGVTVTNANITNITIGTLALSNANLATGTIATLVSSNANITNSTITNLVATNISSGTLNLNIGITAGTILATTSISSGGFYGTNSTITNSVATSSTVTNLVATNISSGTLNLSTGLTAGTILATTSISSGALHATNSTITNAVRTNISSGTLNLSIGITAGTILATTSISSGAVNATNSTVTNSVVTSSTVGTSIITTNLLAIGNSNTVGNIFTTGGNVGINTSTPSTHLHVAGGYSNSINSTTGSLRLEPGWVGHAGIVSFFQANGTRKGYIGYGLDNTAFELHGEGSRQITLFTNDIERMTVTSIGNVGIGTTTPTEKLNVVGNIDLWGTLRIGASSSSSAFQINLGTTGVGSYRSAILYGDGTNIMFSNQQNGNINFGTNNIADRLVIAANGNVGVGTASPSTRLNVNGSTDIFGNLRVGGSSSSTAFNIDLGTNGVGGSRAGYLYGDGTTMYLTNQQNGGINFGTNNAWNKMMIGANGSVGIGTATPDNNLHIYGTGGTMLHVQSTSTTSETCKMKFSTSNGDYYTLNAYGVGEDPYNCFYISDASLTHRFVIARNGYVGIGNVYPPQQPLHVLGRVRISEPNNGCLEIQTLNYMSYIFTNQNGNLELYPESSSNHIYLHPVGGKVAVGTASSVTPSCPLHVKGAGSGGTIRTYPSTYNSESSIGFYSGESSGSYWVAGKGSWSSGDNFAIGSSVYNSSVITLGTNGCTGIRNTSPIYPLHVNGSMTGALVYSYFAYAFMSYSVGSGGGGVPVSIYASDRVAASEFNAFSDSRIKTNVQDVIDSSALETIRQIQPKRYSYIDTLKRTNETVWGFIAQQVGSVLENSTGKIKEFLPNIFDTVSISERDGDTLLTLQNKMTVELDISDNATRRIRLYKQDDTEVFVTLKTVVSSNSFTVEETLSESIYFAYGQEVKDFHTLNKDAIFTVAVAALQEVDRQLQETRTELQQTRTELQQTRTEFQQTVNNLLQRIEILENSGA